MEADAAPASRPPPAPAAAPAGTEARPAKPPRVRRGATRGQLSDTSRGSKAETPDGESVRRPTSDSVGPRRSSLAPPQAGVQVGRRESDAASVVSKGSGGSGASKRRTKSRPKGPPWGQADSALSRALQKARANESVVEAFGSGAEAGFGDRGAEQLAWAIEEGAKASEVNMLSLCVHGNCVGDVGVAALADVMQRCWKLLRLNLGSNVIGDAGVARLCRPLQDIRSLQVLRLHGNRIGDEGAARLAELLGGSACLQELELGSNGLGAPGAAALAEHVGRHPALQILGLSGNTAIGDTGAEALAGSLGAGAALQVLHLGGAGLGEEGALKLAEALSRHEGLRELHLDGNAVGNAGCAAIAQALEGHRGHGGLRALSLERNHVTDDGVLTMLATLSRMQRDNLVCNLKGNPVAGVRWGDATLANLTTAAKTVRRLATRGIRLKKVLKLYSESLAAGKFPEDTATTWDVVESILMPETEKVGVSYSELSHTPPGDYYVIHAWGALFRDLARGLCFHATGVHNASLDPEHVMYRQNPQVLERNYIIDVFACYQCMKHPVGHPERESDKADLLLEHHHARGGEALLLVDSDHLPLTRLWCLTEAHLVLGKGMNLNVTFGTVRPVPRRRRKAALQGAGAHDESERRYLLEELGSSRGWGDGAFDAEVTERLKQLVEQSYRKVLQGMSAEEQSELEWLEQQDDAQEELLDKTEENNLLELQHAIDVGYKVKVSANLLRPALRRRAVLGATAAASGAEIADVLQAIQDGSELPHSLLHGELACLAQQAPKSERRDGSRGAAALLDRWLSCGVWGAAAAPPEGAQGGHTDGGTEGASSPTAASPRAAAMGTPKAAPPTADSATAAAALAAALAEGQAAPQGDSPRAGEDGAGAAGELGSPLQRRGASLPTELGGAPLELGGPARRRGGSLPVALGGEEAAGPTTEDAGEEEEEAAAPLPPDDDELLWLVKLALRSSVFLAVEEEVREPEIDVATVRSSLGIVEREIQKRAAKEAMAIAAERGDITALRRAIDEAKALGVEEGLVAARVRVLRTLELRAARTAGLREKSATELCAAIAAAEEVGVDAQEIEEAKLTLREIDSERYCEQRKADVDSAIAAGDLPLVMRAVELAEEAQADAEFLARAKLRALELELALALAAGDAPALHRALERAQAMDATHVAAAARRKIWIIQLDQAAKGTDMGCLLSLIDSAADAGVEDDNAELLEAMRRHAELQLLEVAENRRQGLSKEELEALLDVALQRGVTNEEAIAPVRRKVGEMHLEQAIVDTPYVTAVRKALKHAQEVGASAALLRRGRKKLASMELEFAMTEDNIRELRIMLSRAQEADVDAEEIKAGSDRLAVLELLDAAAGYDVAVLKSAMSAAEAAGVTKDDMEKAKAKLAKLDPEAYADMRSAELAEALAAGEVGRLREALSLAEGAGVEEADLRGARQVLAEGELQAAVVPGLAPAEVEDGALQALLAATRAALDASRKAGLAEDAPPTTDVAAQLSALQVEADMRAARAALLEASQGTNIQVFKQAIEAAELAGVDPKLIAKMRERLE